MIAPILSEAWRIFRARFGVIAAVVVVVWLPCELLSSYMDAFVFAPDDFRMSFKFARLLDNFVGIIATAGVTWIALKAGPGEPAGFSGAMGAGFSAWGRMWWTRALSGLCVVLGLLLLVVPGVYLLTRLCFVESIAVVEGVSGSNAMRRSFAITNGRFWPVFRLGLALFGLVVFPSLVLILPSALVPALDHWLVDAASQLGCDVIAAYGTVGLFCGYRSFAGESQVA